MAMKSYKTITTTETPKGIVEGAVSELLSLGEELEDWKSGMEGTALENTEKYSTLDDAASQLQCVETPEFDWPHADTQITYYYSTPKRKKRAPSRQVRLGNAVQAIQSVIDFYSGFDSLPEEFDLAELEALVLEIEIPGMYG
jgi:hypothetical protein